MEVLLQGLSKHFGDVVAVDNLTVEIEDGSLVGLLGPSGCGKSNRSPPGARRVPR